MNLVQTFCADMLRLICTSRSSREKGMLPCQVLLQKIAGNLLLFTVEMRMEALMSCKKLPYVLCAICFFE